MQGVESEKAVQTLPDSTDDSAVVPAVTQVQRCQQRGPLGLAE